MACDLPINVKCNGKKISKITKSYNMPAAIASQQSHPKYVDMVCAALKALGGKGASRQAINKYIVKEYSLTENNHHNAMLKSNLKRASAAGGVIVHSKGKGAAGSFKLSVAQESKTTKKPAAKKPAAKKTSAKKTTKKAGRPAKKPEAPKEDKKAETTKSETPKAVKAKAGKKSKAASPKKPKAVKAKTSPKKSPKKLPKRK
ncbi:hypothetical protein QZH41_003489 [Actinostola sp. cb2023]|nr:hypothetical protein QZH41_003489 [Actinostola sp. cb2023]